jgi:hypothetical protein
MNVERSISAANQIKMGVMIQIDGGSTEEAK